MMIRYFDPEGPDPQPDDFTTTGAGGHPPRCGEEAPPLLGVQGWTSL